jgi:putative N6-adenine-specific DNA methylase
MRLFATCARGLEPILTQELESLRQGNIEPGKGGVGFSGSLEDVYRTSLNLRTAVRILRPILESEVWSTDDLYQAVATIDWSQYLTLQHTFAIDCNVKDSEITHSLYAAQRTKDAICDQFMQKFKRRPSVNLDNPMMLINLHISANQMILSLDASGDSLHKRGYRPIQNRAPLNEALTAGLLMTAGYDGSMNLVDPLCGSGTFLIEGAWIALRRPPGLTRKRFGFQGWLDHDQGLYSRVREAERQKVAKELTHSIQGFDIRRDAIDFGHMNTKAASVGNQIQLARQDLMTTMPLGESGGMMICNPPYGERIGEERDLIPLYRRLGEVIRTGGEKWNCWVFSGNRNLLHEIGLKKRNEYRFFNGKIPCWLINYEPTK